MSDSVRPHRQQLTRLPRPWDSPGKNTGVGCHFLLQCMKVKSESEVAQSCPTLRNPMDCSLPGPSVHGIFQARVPSLSMVFCKYVVCNRFYMKKNKQSASHELENTEGKYYFLQWSLSQSFDVPMCFVISLMEEQKSITTSTYFKLQPTLIESAGTVCFSNIL